MIDINRLIRLFHHRWNIRILAAFHSHGGMRFIVLVNRLEVSRDSLRQALLSLTNMNLVQKNPGYGHPMRPEYILTPLGTEVARTCHEFVSLPTAESLLDRKWNVPVLLAVGEGEERFNALRRLLAISPRALTQTLKFLMEKDFLVREISDDYPPTTRYLATVKSRNATRCAKAIAESLKPSH